MKYFERNLNDKHRDIIFFLGCIPVRLLLAYIQNSKYALPLLSVFIGISFIVQGLRWSGEKGLFGGELWWNNMRFVHGMIFILSYYEPRLLYIDVIIGIISKMLNITYR